jgi:hypothetical protein
VTHWHSTAEILRELGAETAVVDGETVEQRLVKACARSIPVAGAAIAWTPSSTDPFTVASTIGVGQVLEDLQFTLGEGPQVTCSIGRRPVFQPDLEAYSVNVWPTFTPQALRLGIRSVFSFPLNVGAISVGVLDLYREETGYLTSDQLATALAYSEAATVVLLRTGDVADPDRLSSGLETPFAVQAEVHQATGMVAVQASVDLRTALVMLRARSFSLGRTVTDVARDVVTRVIRFD